MGGPLPPGHVRLRRRADARRTARRDECVDSPGAILRARSLRHRGGLLRDPKFVCSRGGVRLARCAVSRGSDPARRICDNECLSKSHPPEGSISTGLYKTLTQQLVDRVVRRLRLGRVFLSLIEDRRGLRQLLPHQARVDAALRAELVHGDAADAIRSGLLEARVDLGAGR